MLEVGEVNSTAKADQSQFREGTSLLGAFEETEGQEIDFMSLKNSAKDQEVSEKALPLGEARIYRVFLEAKPVGKPSALTAHAGFDERR